MKTSFRWTTLSLAAAALTAGLALPADADSVSAAAPNATGQAPAAAYGPEEDYSDRYEEGVQDDDEEDDEEEDEEFGQDY
ncbi:hypothetical protein ACIBF1_06875 [Spirillospora sp. NPDC050679]